MTTPRLLVLSAVLGLFGCGPSVATLTQVQTQIFTPKCATAGCHAGAQPAQGLSLEAPSYAKIVNVDSTLATTKKLVVPSSAATSFLYEKVHSSTPASGVQMPNTGVLLSDTEQAMIAEWIDSGAPNN